MNVSTFEIILRYEHFVLEKEKKKKKQRIKRVLTLHSVLSLQNFTRNETDFMNVGY